MGCSPDNAACEGLFGKLKNEFSATAAGRDGHRGLHVAVGRLPGVLLRGAHQGVPGLDEPERVPEEPGLHLVGSPGKYPHPTLIVKQNFLSSINIFSRDDLVLKTKSIKKPHLWVFQ